MPLCHRNLRHFRALAVILWVFGGAAVLEAATVSATWNANAETDIAGYVLHYGTQSGVYSVILDVGNTTNRQVVLAPGLRYYFALKAYNSSQLFSPFSAEVFIDVPAGPNNPPVLTSPGNRTNAENASISLQLVGTDPDGTALTYSATNLPGGLSVNSTTGLISGTLSYTSAGSYTVTATASDGSLSHSQSFTWTVTNVNRAPTLAAPGNQVHAENASVSLQLVGSDPDGTAVNYSATNLPGGLSVNSTTGLISGTLTFTSAGTYSVVATASDGSLSNSKTFTWTVTVVNRVPVLTTPANQTTAENSFVSLSLSASDPDGNSLTFSATNLPAGLSVNSATGVISGTLTYSSAGSYSVTATASDGSLSNSKTFTWTVTNVNRAPVLTAPANQSTVANTAVSLTLVASDPDGNPLTYSATALPGGLAINATTGVISGTPLVTASGDHTVTVGASDGVATTSVSFGWRITSINPVPAVSVLADRTDAAGAALMLGVTASDPGGNPLTYHATRLPDAGLTGLVNSAWRIVGVNDFDGDGHSDLVWRQTQTGDVAVWLLDGTTATAAPVVAFGVPLDWKIVATDDLDGDGKADVVWRHTQTGDVSVWLMDGVTVKDPPIIAAGVPLAWQVVGTGDLDGDGKADLVWRSSQAGDLSVWLMNGATVKAGPVIASGVSLAWRIDGVGDLDGDGKADLVWRHTQTGDVAGWLMDGASIRQGPVISAGGPLEWQILGVKDVDGDEKADLVWRHMPTGSTAVWLMNGVAIKRMPAVY